MSFHILQIKGSLWTDNVGDHREFPTPRRIRILSESIFVGPTVYFLEREEKQRKIWEHADKKEKPKASGAMVAGAHRYSEPLARAFLVRANALASGTVIRLKSIVIGPVRTIAGITPAGVRVAVIAWLIVIPWLSEHPANDGASREPAEQKSKVVVTTAIIAAAIIAATIVAAAVGAAIAVGAIRPIAAVIATTIIPVTTPSSAIRAAILD